MSALIEAKHIYKSFQEIKAVIDLNLHVEPGMIYGIVGPDGAGKTTSMRLLCGALQPAPAGENKTCEIRIAGYDVFSQTEQARSQIGYLPQRFSLYDELTVLENLRFFAEVRGLPSNRWKPRCMELLGFVGLNQFTSRLAGDLSGGMKQKLGLAAALVHEPPVLLLDEPTTGVDPLTRQDFWHLILQIVVVQKKQGIGRSVLISTPYMDEAARCTRIGFLNQGMLIAEGTPHELKQRFHDEVLEIIGEPVLKMRKVLISERGVMDVQPYGDRLHVQVASEAVERLVNEIPILLVKNGFSVKGVKRITPQLEDIFLSLTRSEKVDHEI
jgi:ABC-2 type transport system ATP-binding protein